MEIQEKQYKNGLLKIRLSIQNKYAGEIRLWYMHEISGYISKLSVNAKYQNLGYGGFLLKKAIELFKDNNCVSVRLHVACDNEKAIRLYKCYGFFIVCQISDKIHYLMAKDLG